MLKIALLLFTLTSANFASAQNARELVDIGFRNLDKYIAIELTSLDGKDALKFSLASSTKPGQFAPISSCAYPLKALEQQAKNIADQKVKSDFDWIFFRSGYSASPVDLFYPEFKALLERSNPTCPVQNFDSLKNLLDGMKG